MENAGNMNALAAAWGEGHSEGDFQKAMPEEYLAFPFANGL